MTEWKSETRAVELRVAPGDNTGNTFEGLACQYGVTDAYGTTFQPGCFTRGGLEAGTYALLWMHDPSRPVGTLTAEERADGLYIVGQWDTNTAGQEARIAAMSGSAADLSVGFSWFADPAAADPNLITVAELREVSQVTSRFGAVPGSKLTAVRNFIDGLFSDEEEAAEAPTVDEEVEIAVPAEERWSVTIEPAEEPAEEAPAVEEEAAEATPADEPVEDVDGDDSEAEEAVAKAKRAIDGLLAYARYLTK